MAGIGDFLGPNGVLQQLVLWNLLGQTVSNALDPALTVLRQDVSAAHPVQVIDPGTLADLAARGIITVSVGTTEAARSGISPARFSDILTLHQVRVPPADLATAVLRSYMPEGEAAVQARLQGFGAAEFAILVNLAGDAIGPQDAARALLRGLIPADGKGPGSTSYQQAIAESRLHDKWGPVLRELSHVLLSPADAASAVVRNFLTSTAGRQVAGHQGVDTADFDTLVHLAGDAPAPGQLATALRRGLIASGGKGPASTSFEQGIAEGRLADKWTGVIRGLAQEWPTPTDALDAQVKGQLTAAQGRALYERLGGAPEFHDWLLATIGDSPTPLQAAQLAARGIIPEHGIGPEVISYDQAVKESRYRDKWGPAYRRLSEHIPPPSTITEMLAHRLISDAEAHSLLLQNDMSATLAAAYVAEAHYVQVSTDRGLTQGNVISLYIAHVIDRKQAGQLLTLLHVAPEAARELLDLADLRYIVDTINKSVQRIATLYTGRKIGTVAARDALLKLQIPPHTIDEIISGWQLQAAVNVKVLTEAQIAEAWYREIISDDEAKGELEAIGYTPYDAWIILSLKAKGPIPGKPKRTVAPPSGAVIPGVT